MLKARLQRFNLARFGSAARNLGFGAFSRITALGSQFVVLILLGKFLEKSIFGDFMIVFALIRVLSSGLGTGFATLLVYHISRNATEAREASLHRSVAALVLLVAGAIALGMVVFAPQIAALFAKPTLIPWLMWMAPFFLFSTLLTVSTGALDGRGKITKSITAIELVPNIIRLVALPLLVPFGFPAAGVAGIMLVSVLIPWLMIARPLFSHIEVGFADLTWWDIQYSGKLTLHSFAAMQVQGIDMLIVGWLFTSDIAADYAIASRIAALIPFFQQILIKTFMARAGRSLHEGNTALLQEQVETNRNSTITMVTLTAIGALAAYPFFLHIVGKFESSMPVMAALAAAPLARSFFPTNDPLMRIAGMTNFSLIIMLTSCSYLILFPILLHHSIGIYALPLAMLMSGLTLNPLGARYLLKKLRVRVIEQGLIPFMLISLIGVAICMKAQTDLLIWYGGVAVLALNLIVASLLKGKTRSI